jgi:hypothetical protein
MSTENEKGLTDYYANAAGGGIRFESAPFHGFQIGVSGFYIFNLASSDFAIPDSVTGQFNRYEIALFDIEDPENKADMDRLEEFFIKYKNKKLGISFGRQLINTPFINLQDGRMRPTGVNGAWVHYDPGKKIRMEAGWLYAITPRGTTRWFDIGKSIGVFSTGVNPDGSKSGYADNINSRWVALLGLNYKLSEQLTLKAWNTFTENVFNSALVELNWNRQLSGNSSLFSAGQVIRQDAVNDGGNEDPRKTYFQKGGRSWVLGGRLGWKNKKWEASVNYTRITRDGRYLIPREWGRDPMYTFMPRERNEGLGDVHAVMVKIDHLFSGSGFRSSLSAGYYSLPAVSDYRLNKYGMPSYVQANLDIRYRFKGILQGFESQLLLVGKINRANEVNDKKYIINRVNLLHTNFLLNFYF